MSVFLIRSSLCSIYYFILVQMSGYVNLISKKICITMSPASFPTIKMSRRHTYFMLIVSTGKKEYHIIDIMWFVCTLDKKHTGNTWCAWIYTGNGNEENGRGNMQPSGNGECRFETTASPMSQTGTFVCNGRRNAGPTG